MIKSRPDLVLGVAWLLMAALSFWHRNRPSDVLLHRYGWLIWLISSALLFYRAFRAPPRPVVSRDPLTTVPESKWYAISIALFVLIVLMVPLWLEFHEPDQPMWNGFLAVFLVSLVFGSFVGIRHLQKNRDQIGEARFHSGEDSNR